MGVDVGGKAVEERGGICVGGGICGVWETASEAARVGGGEFQAAMAPGGRKCETTACNSHELEKGAARNSGRRRGVGGSNLWAGQAGPPTGDRMEVTLAAQRPRTVPRGVAGTTSIL